MIYTVTFNPSLDYVVDVKTFKTGQVNRTEQEKMFPGGKGINVSIVLNHLGLKSTAWGFLAGFTGEEISKRLDEEGVKCEKCDCCPTVGFWKGLYEAVADYVDSVTLQDLAEEQKRLGNKSHVI